MERLTYKGTPYMTEDGMVTPTYSDYPTRQIIGRLADYEDLGITPEEMQEIDKLYAEKCRELAECEKRTPPCRIGDTVWVVRNYMGILGVRKGIVSEMLYNRDMELIVVVKNIARGKVGEKVFLSEAKAEQAVERAKRE